MQINFLPRGGALGAVSPLATVHKAAPSTLIYAALSGIIGNIKKKKANNTFLRTDGSLQVHSHKDIRAVF